MVRKSTLMQKVLFALIVAASALTFPGEGKELQRNAGSVQGAK